MDPQNPYAPPQAADHGAPQPVLPMDGPPSSVPKVFGTLSIVFASLIGLGGMLGSCSLFAAGFMDKMPMDSAKAEQMRPMMQAMKTVYGGIGLESVLFLGMSIWLLVLGIGQLRYRAWACRQSVVWGLVGLVAVAAMVAISVLVIGPAYKQMFEGIAQAVPRGDSPQMKMPSGMGMMLGGSLSAMLVFFYAPYPILMIAMFTRDRVRAAMTT